MKFAIACSLIWALFLNCFELGYSSRTSSGGSTITDNTGPTQPQPQPPRFANHNPYAFIEPHQRKTIGNGLLAKVGGNLFVPIHANTYSIFPAMDGYHHMVKTLNGFCSGLYYPETHDAVMINKDDITDVRPVGPGRLSGDEDIQKWKYGKFHYFTIENNGNKQYIKLGQPVPRPMDFQ